MFGKMCTTILCIAAAVVLFDWTGRFHVIVGLPLLVGMEIIGWKLQQRQHDDESDDLQDLDEEAPGVGHSLCVGGLQGAAVVGALALAFVVLSDTSLRAFIEGPDCQAILREIDILTTAQAHVGIVQVVDTAEQRPLGPVCRQDLRERKVRALLALAKDAPEAQRLGILEQAQGGPVEDADLKQLVINSVQAETERLRIEQQVGKLSEANDKRQAEIDALKALIATLRELRFTVEETPEGVEVILSEQDALRFAPNKADLDDSGCATVKRLADLLAHPPYNEKRVQVIGYTDTTGSNHEALSEARARSVLQALVQHGVPDDRLKA